MTGQACWKILEWSDKYIRTFLYSNTETRDFLLPKMQHAVEVGLEARRIAISLDLSDDKISLAEAVGLLHDIGRFEQYARYKTFLDYRSINHVEEAERAEDPVERERWLTFVVIGGGPTGVELAGELAIVAGHTMKGYFRRISPAQGARDPARRRRAGDGSVQQEALGQGRRVSGDPGCQRSGERAGHLDRRRRRDRTDGRRRRSG